MNWLSKLNHSPRAENAAQKKKISGTSETISKYVYNDILGVQTEIKRLNEKTGVLTSNGIFSRLYTLLGEEQAREYESLRKKFRYEKSKAFYDEQLQLYKSHLQELVHILDMFQNSHTSNIYKGNQSKRKSTSLEENRTGSSSASLLSKEEVDEIINNEAPDQLIDPISFNLFSDPVVTPSGITYEKSLLLQHMQAKGGFDPLTRAPIKESQLYSNLVVKESVLEYMRSKEEEITKAKA
ncbi:hypothetical protein CLIB1423_09S01442 [[Candida] railenensis]|uniref:RING-type E3 ubiquitin transferase n=1 Tax=[Candida] railenensis TaxID=45579 RepID=A0A9P0QQF2_9ASCO|nr:hypothetical protein CLIB1423_09S01442 [[Candida] railenensis]